MAEERSMRLPINAHIVCLFSIYSTHTGIKSLYRGHILYSSNHLFYPFFPPYMISFYLYIIRLKNSLSDISLNPK